MPAGCKRVSFASLKLLRSSVGGTHRSSTQKKWTFDQLKTALASAENSSFGVLPPEIAMVACGCELKASASCLRIYSAHPSANSSGALRIRNCGELFKSMNQLPGTIESGIEGSVRTKHRKLFRHERRQTCILIVILALSSVRAAQRHAVTGRAFELNRLSIRL